MASLIYKKWVEALDLHLEWNDWYGGNHDTWHDANLNCKCSLHVQAREEIIKSIRRALKQAREEIIKSIRRALKEE